MAEICVIIPMYGFAEYTNKCVDLTLKNAGVPVDILVIDDCSKEPYKNSKVEVLRLDKNLGFTGATNAGIVDVWDSYKYLHLLNNDTKPYPDFIKELLVPFGMDPNVGIACSVRETDYEGERVLINQPVDCLAGNCQYTAEDLEDPFYYNVWIALCSSLIRTDVIRQVGLLDRRMKNHCSDNDFCVRAGVMGYTTVLVPKSKVFHHHEITTKSLGLEASGDQMVLIQKIRCDYIRQMLEKYPLDARSKVKHELIFREVMPNAQAE